MRRAYLVDVSRSEEDDETPRAMRYAALVETPEQAVEAVRPLLSDRVTLACKGEVLSPAAALALGLRPGYARLV